MNRISMYRVQLIKVQTKLFENAVVRSPKDAVKIVNEYFELSYGGLLDREMTVALYLNTKNKVTGIETISIGTLNAALIHPRELFKGAMEHNAAAIIMAHNHPSGDSTPSPEDIEMTNRIIECGDLMGIEILDHVVVAEEGYASLKEQGLI